MWAGAPTRRLSLDDRRPRGWPATVATTEPTSTDNPSHLGDFGANEWLVEDMYERFLTDPDSVDAAWHDFFADYRPGRSNGTPKAQAPAPAPAEPEKPAAAAPQTAAKTEVIQNRPSPAARP